MTYRWPKPEGVPTAMTLPEVELLQTYAHEVATVLEIGALYGYSTIAMALVGAHVTSVDPHYDGPADAPDTWERFLYNVRAHGVMSNVLAKRRSAYDFDRQEPAETRYGLVFIDGDHTWPQPWEDAQMALRRLTEPGYIAMHDIHPLWPGVVRAAALLESEGLATQVAAAACLRVYHCKASSVSGMSSKPTEAL